MVKLRLPPPTRNVTPQFEILKPGQKLLRIFDPTRYGATAIGFRHYGPLGRFDHHRGKTPAADPARGIIYAGMTLSCCLVEVFGDGDVIEVNQQQVACLTLTDSLKLLDLRGAAAMQAGTVAAISAIAQRSISQAWGRYFYEHPQLYQEVDGLIFNNAHNAEEAIALYERAKRQITSADVKVMELNHPELRSAIFRIAARHDLLVQPYG
ncbi:MAG: RES family NAD+ phosphorylase [Microcystaceae cyanobacterium]